MYYYEDIKLTKYRYSACLSLDVIQSENSRNQLTNYSFLKKICKTINKEYSQHLVVDFQIRRGDEVIGVLNSFSAGYKVFERIWLLAFQHNIKLRVGLGLGQYDTINAKNVDEINGSSVISSFRARDLYLKKGLSEYPLLDPVQIYVHAKDRLIPHNSLNALISATYDLIKTEKQMRLVWALKQNEGSDYEDIAAKYTEENWTRSSISKMKKRIDYDRFERMNLDIINLLNTIHMLLDKEWREKNS